MTKLTTRFPLGALVGAALLATSTVAQEVTVFRNVSVIPMDTERVLDAQTVVVRGERIESISAAASAQIPQNARVIDGSGRYLVPGLAEMHAHVPPGDDPQYVEEVLFLYVANGVTTARGMLGTPSHLQLRERLARHDVLGPRLFTSGPSLNDNSVGSADDAARIVSEQARAGYDFVKVHPGPTRAEYDAAVQAGAASGIKLAGHVPADVGVLRANSVRRCSIALAQPGVVLDLDRVVAGESFASRSGGGQDVAGRGLVLGEELGRRCQQIGPRRAFRAADLQQQAGRAGSRPPPYARRGHRHRGPC